MSPRKYSRKNLLLADENNLKLVSCLSIGLVIKLQLQSIDDLFLFALFVFFCSFYYCHLHTGRTCSYSRGRFPVMICMPVQGQIQDFSQERVHYYCMV